MKVFVTGTRGIPEIQGGVETHCAKLYPRLAAMGHDITVSRRKPYVRDARHMWQGVRLIDLPAPRMRAFEAIIHTLLSVVWARLKHAGIVHIHSIGPALVAPLARVMGMRVIVTHHRLNYEDAKWGATARRLLRLGEGLACRYADAIITVNNEIKHHLATHYERTNNVFALPNGIEPSLSFEPSILSDLSITPYNYIIAVGRLVPEKNFHQLIEAYSKSTLPSRGIKLVICGDCDNEYHYSSTLRAQAESCGVIMPGYISGAPLNSLLAHASCFVLTSFTEGHPIALLEAMSHGTPVICSDIAATREMPLPDESYFRVGDVEALVAKLNGISDEALNKRCRYDLSAYDWDKIAEMVSQIYRRVV